MRQAIEERFVLDVLTNYTTYSVYYRCSRRPRTILHCRKKRPPGLAKFMSLHPIISSRNRGDGGALPSQRQTAHRRQSQGHVVTSSRLHAVRYMKAIERYIAENGYQDVAPGGFQRTVKDPENGGEYTEPGMNIDVVSGKPISRSSCRALQLTRLSDPAGGQQIPDRL